MDPIEQQQQLATDGIQSAEMVAGGSTLTIVDGEQESVAASGQQVVCAVCGEENSKMHYGVLACLGCKGFFRRALKKVNEYECLRNNNCTIDKQGRNSCRSCRLQKCLDVGMDPAAVRPDRDFTGKQQQLSRRLSVSSSRRKSQQQITSSNERKNTSSNNNEGGDGSKSWAQKLPVESRTMLMSLQNIEAKVVHGDTTKDAAEIYPLRINTIREVIEEPTKLCGRRTEMRYEPYRMARNEELSVIVYRRLIAAIDWVQLLAERMGGLSTEDKISLVKSCFGPLTLFKCSARTASVTEKEDMLCLCNFAYVPREISKAYNDAYHLDNGLVERLLNELVSPFRRIRLADEEVVCVSAIIVLNPMAKDLSEEAADKVFQLRNKIYITLYQMIKECRPDCNPNATFGNLLLYLPIIASLANAMSENLRFAQTFSTLGGIPLLTSMFGCFPVEPFLDSEMAMTKCISQQPDVVDEETAKEQGKKKKTERKHSTVSTQTEWSSSKLMDQMTRKRRLNAVLSLEESNEFHLLKAPCSYTLAEMFDDRINEEEQRLSTSAEISTFRPEQMNSYYHLQTGAEFAHQNCSSEQQLCRQPSTSWSNNISSDQRQDGQSATTTSIPVQQQQMWSADPTQQWMASNSGYHLTATIDHPPTTQIQGLYLNDKSGGHRIHESVPRLSSNFVSYSNPSLTICHQQPPQSSSDPAQPSTAQYSPQQQQIAHIITVTQPSQNYGYISDSYNRNL